MQRRQLTLGTLSATLCATLGAPALAQDVYPSKPVTIVVPFTAGGSTDIAARIVGQQLARALGQPVIVDNKPGAGATLGAAFAARATPDGYTLFWGGNSPLTTSPHLYKKPGYDPITSFEPIGMLAVSPWVLLAKSALPARSVSELTAQAKAQPGKLNFGSSGVNSALHLLMEEFKSARGIDAVHVPYKGDSDVAQAVVSGQVDFAFAALSTSLPFIQSGRLKALAVTGPERDRQLPDVPTLAEAGVPSMKLEFFSGLLAPAGTPAPVIARLTSAVHTTMKDPGVRERLQKAGAEPADSTPQEFRDMIARDSARWQALIKRMGVVPE